jgi:hypothetical protein
LVAKPNGIGLIDRMNETLIELAATGKFSIVTKSAMPVALDAANGSSYKIGLIQGNESISGSTLKGKAKKYSSSYRKSAEKLIKDLTCAGLVAHSEMRDGKRMLVITSAGEEI